MHGSARGGQGRGLGVGPVRFEIFLAPAGEGRWVMGGIIPSIIPGISRGEEISLGEGGGCEGNHVCEGDLGGGKGITVRES